MSVARGSSALVLLVLALTALAATGCGSSDEGQKRPDPVTSTDAKDLATLPLADAGTQGGDAAGSQGQGRSVEARKLEQIEKRLNALETEFAELKPAIKRLVLVEYDIRVLLDKMETVAYREAAGRGAGPAGGTGRDAAISGAQLVPLGAAAPATAAPPAAAPPAATPPGEPATLAIEPVQPPARPAAAATAASGSFGLHLASYGGQDTLDRGWSILRKRFAGELAGMQHAGQSVELGGTRGRVLRLVAGPVADRARAQAVCGSLERAGQYCKVVRF